MRPNLCQYDLDSVKVHFLAPDCLEKAVGVLQELRHKNKTVGVISHVELLKDRISTQVEFVVLPEGKRELRIS